MASESLNDHGNVPRIGGAPGTISSEGTLESYPDGYYKTLQPNFPVRINKGYISSGGPKLNLNDHLILTKEGPPGTISREGILEMNETQQQWGGGVHSGGGGEVYNKEQKEIENAAIIIANKLTNVLSYIKPVPKSCTIYKVPKNLKDAYGGTSFEPKLINIGPFNNYKTSEAIHTHKWRFFSRFLSSMNNTSSTTTATTSTVAAEAESSTVVATQSKKIECLFAVLKKIEASSRACYSEGFQYLCSQDFIEMMMVDGCFIIELLRLCEKLGKENIVDPLFSSRLTMAYIRHDLLILENQLPFPVLETLFEMSTISGNVDQHQPSLKYLILKFFNPLLSRDEKVIDHVLTVVREYKKPHHLLDFFRSSFRTTQQEIRSTHINVSPSTSNNDQDPHVLINYVTRLKEAEIEFKKRENHNLLDIEFKNGKLYIPPLLIDENTYSVFLNFIVYEQCNQFLGPYFTNYLLFFDCLVDTSTDIEHLHSEGIIDHVLSSDEQVANLFNMLCKDAVHDLSDNYLSNVLKYINRYSGRRWNRWRAELKHTYFTNPWAFISFLAAVFLLILTTIQTFFAVYAYYFPPSSGAESGEASPGLQSTPNFKLHL